jgi:hypothetical protein
MTAATPNKKGAEPGRNQRQENDTPKGAKAQHGYGGFYCIPNDNLPNARRRTPIACAAGYMLEVL